MIKKFLTAKHWQLFLLVFGLPMVIHIAAMITLITGAGSGNLDPTFIFKYMSFFILLIIVVMAVHYGWFWSVAIGLQGKVPEGIKMKVRKFKIFFMIPMIYMALFLAFMSYFLGRIDIENPEQELMLFSSLFVIIVPMHLISMVCIFYCLYFVAKTIKTVELQREVSFSDFIGEFFMVWFYPIGIWIIQPKINRLQKS